MKVLYPGSFDPFTIGHLDIVRRSLSIFGEVIIGVGFNEHKKGMISPLERLSYIQKIFEDEPRVSVECYSGLTIEFAKSKDISIIVRGVRNISDFEMEKQLAETNKAISNIETVFIPCEPSLSFISSSMVRELFNNGYNIEKYLPLPLNFKISEK